MNKQTKLTKGQKDEQKGKCKNNHSSPMSNSAWCDWNSKGDVLKLHDRCPNAKCIRQKQNTFAPRKFQMEGNVFKKMAKYFKSTQTAGNKFLNPAVNTLAPVIGMSVGAKSKSPQVGQATTNILKSISGGNILSLTAKLGNGL